MSISAFNLFISADQVARTCSFIVCNRSCSISYFILLLTLVQNITQYDVHSHHDPVINLDRLIKIKIDCFLEDFQLSFEHFSLVEKIELKSANDKVINFSIIIDFI